MRPFPSKGCEKGHDIQQTSFLNVFLITHPLPLPGGESWCEAALRDIPLIGGARGGFVKLSKEVNSTNKNSAAFETSEF